MLDLLFRAADQRCGPVLQIGHTVAISFIDRKIRIITCGKLRILLRQYLRKQVCIQRRNFGFIRVTYPVTQYI